MTNSEVFIAKCLHYNPSPLMVKDLLDDVGLKSEENCTDKRKVVSAVLAYLSGVRSLKSESEADCSNSYDVEGLTKHIVMLCKQFGYDSSEYLSGDLTEIEDGSCMW
ncbi:hypothetical protein KQP74_15830 [Bacteroides thetaiotaomicron]|uniref:Uncharacterized protein n=1 Tax=Bacteroides thetaiotaomicron TaxID=818 RepID=A0AB38U972_BACT4|nr:DUF6706 family protein [Bacteroides thetaiotaomicron]UYU89415.1 hypothetical protein KQP74_15830 [Bacteroides thetaiotaomicron]DAX74952.1 MAG TPA: hypothetical protein [Caudoviricetes sp.]